MLLFTILLWAWAWSPGSAFIIIYTNDRKLGQWEAKREIQPSCTQLLWIVCRKRGLLRGKEKFSSLAGLNQGVTTFPRWDRVLLPEQSSAAHCSHSLALSLPQDSSLSQSCIIHTLKYHVVKQVIPQKDVLPLGTSVQFLATFLSFLHSTVCPVWGDLWCSAGEAACRRIYSSSFHCCCSGRLSPTPSVLTLGKSNDGLWKYTIKLLWKLVSSCVHSKFLPVWGWRRGCRLLYAQTTKQEGTERKSICSNTSPPSFSSQYKFNPPYTRRGELVQHNIMEQLHFTETLQKAESLWDQSL